MLPHVYDIYMYIIYIYIYIYIYILKTNQYRVFLITDLIIGATAVGRQVNKIHLKILKLDNFKAFCKSKYSTFTQDTALLQHNNAINMFFPVLRLHL